jgi:hypothetical protein
MVFFKHSMKAAARQYGKLLFSFPVRESGKRTHRTAMCPAGMNHELGKARRQRLQGSFKALKGQPSFQIKTPEMIRRFHYGTMKLDPDGCREPAKPLRFVIQQWIVSIHGSCRQRLFRDPHPWNPEFPCRPDCCVDRGRENMCMLVPVQMIHTDAGVAQRLNLGGKFPPDFFLKRIVVPVHQAPMALLFAAKASVRACDGFQPRTQRPPFGQVQMDAE